MNEEQVIVARGSRHQPGVVAPVVNRNRCEGKADCVRVCPHGVFEMGQLGRAERQQLSLASRLRGFLHRYRQVFVVQPDRCDGCGRCVTACPERAIKLAKRNPARPLHAQP
ncbi:MAG: ferredoxin family protein [Chloroflexi bacterium]|nr:ferredoxin family protein [Chloroflexota bacterium]